MTCSREGCANEFAPRAPHQKYCAATCRDAARQGSTARLASRRAHNHRRGWYVAYKSRLARRIRQRLEEVG